MRYSYSYSSRGFTLIELLVVISIIAVLAAILFPVFARAREKAMQTTCASNQRQIVAAILMYAQDHEETLPGNNVVWTETNIEGGVLVCPTLGNKIPNGYIYDGFLSTTAVGEVTDPTQAFMTVDGFSADVVAPGLTLPYGANVLYSTSQYDPRHSNKYIASFVDGHVETRTQGTLTLPNVPNAPYTSVLGSARNVASGNIINITSATPSCTLPAGYAGKIPNLTVGTKGFLCPWFAGVNPPSTTNTPPTRKFLSPFTDITTWTGGEYTGGYGGVTINIDGSGGGSTYGTTNGRPAGSFVEIPMTVTDNAMHRVTVISGGRFGSEPDAIYSVYNLLNAEGAAKVIIAQEGAPHVAQFQFRGNHVLRVECQITHGDPYTWTTVAAILFD